MAFRHVVDGAGQYGSRYAAVVDWFHCIAAGMDAVFAGADAACGFVALVLHAESL